MVMKVNFFPIVYKKRHPDINLKALFFNIYIKNVDDMKATGNFQIFATQRDLSPTILSTSDLTYQGGATMIPIPNATEGGYGVFPL